MIAVAVRWGGRLTHHVCDAHGLPQYGIGGVPVTVTVGAWGSDVSRIPDGPTMSVAGTVIPPRSTSYAALERVIDHVHSWTGMTDGGKPIPCTRNAVKAMCIADESFWREVKRAIRLACHAGGI